MVSNKLFEDSISDTQLSYENPKTQNNLFFQWAGLGIHLVNKIRHELQGYKSARGFSTEEINRVIQYDLGVVKRWKDYLQLYAPGSEQLRNKKILELGPGADLGIGLICLAEGASHYYAMDVHNLVQYAPDALYTSLFDYFEKKAFAKKEIAALKDQYQFWKEDQPKRLNYLCQKNFDLRILEGKKIDLVLSNSAFQQFDDPNLTCQQLNKIVAPGGYFVALIDLKTHTRWIKQKDPLNIYRYPEWLYKVLKFRGIQNRMRPFEFKLALEQNGWNNVKIYPRLKLEPEYVNCITPSLHPRFQALENEMDCLTVVICATKV